MKFTNLLKIIILSIIIALFIWNITSYNYSLDIDNMVGNRLYIKSVGDVVVDCIWKRNNKVIIVYTNEIYNDQMGYAFFKKGIISGKYKEYHKFTMDDDVIHEAIQVENVLISIDITKDDIVERNFTIKKDWSRSSIFRIFVIFLLCSFVTRSKKEEK